MILVITEKFTQRETLEKLLKNTKRDNLKSEGFFGDKKIVIVSLSGHIFNIPDLAVFDKRFESKSYKQTKDLLPVYPPENSFYPRVLSNSKYKNLYELIKNLAFETEGIILATDPDFEGAALGFEVLFYIKGALKKIIAMMDMNNLNINVLKKEFVKALKGEGLDYKTLAYIGLLRGDLNYGVGINTSRYLIGSLEDKATFGTQQSRLIDLIIKRTQEYFNFKKQKYYTLKIQTDIGDFVLKLENEEERFNKQFFEEIKKRIGDVKEIPIQNVEKKIKKEKSLKWYDGSDVAQEASKILKIPAIQLMDEKTGLLEKMYLKNILTYPRGESKGVMPLSELQNQINIAKAIAPLYNANCDFSLVKKDVWYDDSKKSLGVNHTPFTIARGDIDINKLSKEEKIVFDIVAKRLLSMFYPNPEVLEKTIKVKIKDFNFILKEESDLTLGYKELYKEKKRVSRIPDNIKKAVVEKIVIEEKETQPKPLFTINSIVKEMKRKKIGAESTYKQLVQTITDKNRPYIKIEKGKLIPTKFAINFFKIIPDEAINILDNFEAVIIEGLINKKITFSQAFRERNRLIEKVFNLVKNEIDNKIDFLVEELKKINIAKEKSSIIGKCPLCGGDVIEKDKYYTCINRKVRKEGDKWIEEGCNFLIFKKVETPNMRFSINKTAMQKLLNKKIAEVKAYSKNKNKNFSLKIKLENNKIKFVF